MIEVAPDQARSFVLDTQAIRSNSPCQSVMDVARRIHNIQIDTISVVTRSHNLICFNRFSDYYEGDVWEAQKSGKLFEYSSHAQCLMPIESLPFYMWKMHKFREQEKGYWAKWGRENRDLVDAVYDHVKKNGVTSSSDFKDDGRKRDGWWDWKKEKRALEFLATEGRLMVAFRSNFQKHFDVSERVVPLSQSTEPMPEDMIPEYIVSVVFGSLGLASAQDLKTYVGRRPARVFWSGRTTEIESYLEGCCKSGVLTEVAVGGANERYFVLSSSAKVLEQSLSRLNVGPVRFLSPFDNIVRDRHYPKHLWGFGYRLEAYTPAKDREYGYYVLPMLHGINIVGRVDMKVHRKDSTLEILSLYLEHDDTKSDDFPIRLCEGLRDFGRFHSCRLLKIGSIHPQERRTQLIDRLEDTLDMELVQA